jgi:hypothetical protein
MSGVLMLWLNGQFHKQLTKFVDAETLLKSVMSCGLNVAGNDWHAA